MRYKSPKDMLLYSTNRGYCIHEKGNRLPLCGHGEWRDRPLAYNTTPYHLTCTDCMEIAANIATPTSTRKVELNDDEFLCIDCLYIKPEQERKIITSACAGRCGDCAKEYLDLPSWGYAIDILDNLEGAV